MKRERGMYVAILLCLALALGSQALASSISITDATGDPGSVSINAGDSFVIDVKLTADVGFNGVTYFLAAPGAGSGKFRLTGRDISVGPFTTADLTTTNTKVLALANAVLDPQNGKLDGSGTDNCDLGATFADSFQELTGTYTIARYTIASDAAIALGAYQITIPRASFNRCEENEFETVNLSTANVSYTVNILPEPVSMLGLLFGLPMILRGRVA